MPSSTPEAAPRSHYADQHVEVAGFAMLFEDANQLFVVGETSPDDP